MRSKKIKNRLIGSLLILIFSLMLGVINYKSVAAITLDEVFTRVLVNKVESCYNYAFVNSIEASRYLNFNSLMNEGYKASSNPSMDTKNVFYVPTLSSKYNNLSTQDSLGGRFATCYALFASDKSGSILDGSMKGLLEIYGVNQPLPTNWSSISDLNGLMDSTLQYSINTEGASKDSYCYTVYTKGTVLLSEEEELGSVCVNEDNYPLSKKVFSFSNKNEKYTVSASEEADSDGLYDKIRVTVTSNKDQCIVDYGEIANCSASLSLPIGVEEIETGDFNLKIDSSWVGAPNIYIRIAKGDGSGEDSKNVSYNKGGGDVWKSVITSATKGDYSDKVPFSDAEKYDYYLQYLSRNYGQSGTSIGSSVCQEDKPNQLVNVDEKKYYIFIKDSGWCLANLSEARVNNNSKMTVFAEGENYILNKVIDNLPDLINLMGKLDYSNPDEFTSIEKAGQGVTPGSTGGDSDVDGSACYKGSGALGWILCPIVEAASGVGRYMWKQVETYHLQTPAQEIFEDDGGVRKVWNVTQNIANIIFIILFLFVIFSQLTGVGIDNYGIKKILPKLIVVIILLNLSYIICELAVDLSNILGVGLNNLLSGAAHLDQVIIPEASDISQGTGWTVDIALAGGGLTLFGILNGGATVLAAGAAIGLLVLGVVITVVVAMLVLYLILIIREAGIIILIVLAPIAMVCYLLPNTEKLYKKWFDLFKALLVVYPLCGLMVGAGKLAGVVLASVNVPSMKIAAMIVQVLPFFLVPTLLKSSLSMLGNVGAKLSSFGRSFGQRASRGARGAIQNSERFKNWSQDQKSQAALRRANAIHERLQGRKDLNRYQKLRLKAANDTILGEKERMNRAESSAGVGYSASEVAQQKRFEAEETGNYMTLVNNETRNGEQEDKLFDLYEQYMKDGNKSGAVAVARIAGRRKDTAQRFMDSKFNNIGKYSPEMAQSIAKEIATGENSKMYMESTPTQFEYAALLNKLRYNNESKNYEGVVKEKDKAGNIIEKTITIPSQYKTIDANGNIIGGFVSDMNNISGVIDKYITDHTKLAGMKGSALRELYQLKASGQMKGDDAATIETLAREVIENRDRFPLDYSKAQEFADLTGGAYTWDARKREFIKTANNVNNQSNDGRAKEGEAFNVNNGGRSTLRNPAEVGEDDNSTYD